MLHTTFGSLFEGQGHCMTFQRNCVRLIPSLFEVLFKKLIHINDHHVETTCRAQHLDRYLEGQGHSMTFSKIVSGPILCYFSRILQLLLTKYFSVSNTYSGSITRFRPALVYI